MLNTFNTQEITSFISEDTNMFHHSGLLLIESNFESIILLPHTSGIEKCEYNYL